MLHPERLRAAARFHLRACAATADPNMKERHAEHAFELAQMAEAAERAAIETDRAS